MSANEETEKKRKRDEIEGQNGAVTAAERTTVAVGDREVDEFFAILRRMHTALSHLKKPGVDDGGGLPLTERQGVRSEDDGDRNCVNGGDHSGLDLNADPIPEPDPV